MQRRRLTLICALICGVLLTAPPVNAQKKLGTAPAKKTIVAKAEPANDAPAVVPAKKNERPDIDGAATQERTNKRPDKNGQSQAAAANGSNHFYEFAQPAFVISKVLIEHDENGKGRISFMKKGYEELIADPIQVSAEALERINAAFIALDFINSTENYQYEKDFSHLGVMKIRLKDKGKERTATFSWTQNKDAKTLADEYRKIGNQFIWIFDISLARENQPLEAPKLLESLDSMIRRNEISDPKQMLPFLQKMTNDERFPLIARNHAGKLVKQIEKEKSK
ncbi:MAG: hypothetical protein WKF92_04845 [Pyrinomonadaceae bacterium]